RTYIYPDLMMRLRMGDPVLRTYVWRYLNSPPARAYFQAKATGTAGNMPKINGETVRSLQVPVPPRAEMAEIVCRLAAAYSWLARLSAEHARAAQLLPKLEQAILAKAFRGQLVPQDPNDEPASALLDRIRAARAEMPARGRARSSKAGRR